MKINNIDYTQFNYSFIIPTDEISDLTSGNQELRKEIRFDHSLFTLSKD